MARIIIHKPHLCTRLDIIAPRWHDSKVLLSQKKVSQASPIMLIEFRTKSLKGQRFCARRAEVEKYPVETNGRIPCYAVPMDDLDSYDTAQEVRDIALNLFPD